MMQMRAMAVLRRFRSPGVLSGRGPLPQESECEHGGRREREVLAHAEQERGRGPDNRPYDRYDEERPGQGSGAEQQHAEREYSTPNIGARGHTCPGTRPSALYPSIAKAISPIPARPRPSARNDRASLRRAVP